MKKSDVNTLKRGLKYLGLSLLTTAFFALGVVCVICTSQLPGYAAVALFFGSVISFMASYVGLFTLGVVSGSLTESKGERK